MHTVFQEGNLCVLSDNLKFLYTYSLFHRLNSHFPGESGLGSFIEAEDDGNGVDN